MLPSISHFFVPHSFHPVKSSRFSKHKANITLLIKMFSVEVIETHSKIAAWAVCISLHAHPTRWLQARLDPVCKQCYQGSPVSQTGPHPMTTGNLRLKSSQPHDPRGKIGLLLITTVEKNPRKILICLGWIIGTRSVGYVE